MMYFRRLSLVFVSLFFCIEASAASEQETMALVSDVQIIVSLHEQTSWYADAFEIEEIIEDVLRSVCLAKEDVRTQALVWLGSEIDRKGGDAKKVWLENNKNLSKVKTLLRLERVRKALRQADDIARAQGCPFWVETSTRFLGEQSYAERLIIGFEAGGRFMLGWQNQSFGFGGGGASRLLVGMGTKNNLSILGGFEFGGGGRFSDVHLGKRLEMPSALFILAAPLVVRWHHLVSFNEFELSPAVYLNQLDDVFQPGVQSALGLGFPRTKLAGILPHVTFWLSYSYFGKRQGASEVHQICGGLRAGGSYLINVKDN